MGTFNLSVWRTRSSYKTCDKERESVVFKAILKKGFAWWQTFQYQAALWPVFIKVQILENNLFSL